LVSNSYPGSKLGQWCIRLLHESKKCLGYVVVVAVNFK
jgi:hypothetical protein